MPGDPRIDRLDESGDRAQLPFGVIDGGNDQRGHLDPDSKLPHQLYSIQNGLERCAEIFAVNFVSIGLDVYVDPIEVGGEHLRRFRGQVAVADEHIFDPGIMGQLCRIIGELEENGRLDIGISDRLTAAARGIGHDFFRRKVLSDDLAPVSPRIL